MNLSKLTLNLRCSQVRAEIAKPYEMHRSLLKAFTQNGNLAQNRILFRIESPEQNNISAGIDVLVQSQNLEPDWNNLTVKENYFLIAPQTKKVNITTLPKGLYKFKLVANPTIKRNGKRFGLYKEEEQIQWFKRNGLQHGFEPVFLNCSDFTIGSKSKTFKMKDEILKSEIYHYGVSFQGILRVSDSDKIIKALQSGIGSAKAFGFGLLTIARAD